MPKKKSEKTRRKPRRHTKPKSEAKTSVKVLKQCPKCGGELTLYNSKFDYQRFYCIHCRCFLRIPRSIS